MFVRSLRTTALLLVSSGAALGQVGDLYWTENITGVAMTMDTHGISSSTLASSLSSPAAIDADAGAGKVFFTDGLNNIGRVNTDGTGLQTIISNAVVAPSLGVAVDDVNQKVWWTDWNTGDVKNANYDGTGAQTVFNAGPNVSGLVIDPNAGKVYMAANTTIKSANMNGTGLTTLFTLGTADFHDIALDDANGKLYWTDAKNNKVQMANLNGSNVQDVLTTGLSTPIGIDLDPALGEFYVANKGSSQIVAASLQGANAHVLYTAPVGATTWGLAVVVPAPGAATLAGLGVLCAVRRRRR